MCVLGTFSDVFVLGEFSDVSVQGSLSDLFLIVALYIFIDVMPNC